MTEEEWLICSHPIKMLEFLDVSDRKQRLVDCACVRRIWHLMLHESGRRAVETAERYADGLATSKELRKAQAAALVTSESRVARFLPGTPDSYSVLAAAASTAWEFRGGVDPLYYAADAISWESITEFGRSEEQLAKTRFATERANQAALVREIFGNPFRPVTIDPRWQTSTVVDLARAIYDERAFDRMSILADALMDAGCDSDAIIEHCRQSTEHARGCWLADLLLGKS